jgi:D-3-phosphoglycerate dehydrogenase
MKILISDHLEQRGIEILEAEGYTVQYKPGIPREELESMVRDSDALVVRSSTAVDARLINLGAQLKVIGRAGTGVDNIDVDAATRRGILVMNTPGGNTISAAEHTISMMLSLARNIPQAHMSTTKGGWDRKRFVGMEVYEKTIGIVGLGRIGREVAQRCLGLGMRVIGYDPVLQEDAALKLQIELVSLAEVFRRSDFITFHTPLTPDTQGLLNERTLAQCKKGVRIINCARGGIIDEEALLRSLVSGHVGGAALDVFEVEPPRNTQLLSHERVIVTPHLGASTEEAQEKVAVQIAHQVVDALEERAFVGVVNASSRELSVREELKPYLTLAEKLGMLAAQTLPGKLRGLALIAKGELVSESLDLLKAGLLKGLLSHLHHDPVNLINAPVLAREMGLTVQELKEGSAEGFVRYDAGGEVREIAGTVFGASSVRLVQLDGFPVEVNPSGYLLSYRNIDRPGMLAKVGSILAARNVNIAGVSLGRSAMGATALTVMNLDSGIDPETRKQLCSLEGVSDVRVMYLP